MKEKRNELKSWLCVSFSFEKEQDFEEYLNENWNSLNFKKRVLSFFHEVFNSNNEKKFERGKTALNVFPFTSCRFEMLSAECVYESRPTE